MTVREIMRVWLKARGYDGLWSPFGDCVCKLGAEFMDCQEFERAYGADCRPGWEVPCSGEDECENYPGCKFHIGPEKPEKEPPCASPTE